MMNVILKQFLQIGPEEAKLKKFIILAKNFGVSCLFEMAIPLMSPTENLFRSKLI